MNRRTRALISELFRQLDAETRRANHAEALADRWRQVALDNTEEPTWPT